MLLVMVVLVVMGTVSRGLRAGLRVVGVVVVVTRGGMGLGAVAVTGALVIVGWWGRGRLRWVHRLLRAVVIRGRLRAVWGIPRWRMGWWSGLLVVWGIRERPGRPAVPVVVVSGRSRRISRLPVVGVPVVGVGRVPVGVPGAVVGWRCRTTSLVLPRVVWVVWAVPVVWVRSVGPVVVVGWLSGLVGWPVMVVPGVLAGLARLVVWAVRGVRVALAGRVARRAVMVAPAVMPVRAVPVVPAVPAVPVVLVVMVVWGISVRRGVRRARAARVVRVVLVVWGVRRGLRVRGGRRGRVCRPR